MISVLTTRSDPVADAALKQLIAPYGIELEFCPSSGVRLLQLLQSRYFSAALLRCEPSDLLLCSLPAQYRARRQLQRSQLLPAQPDTLFFALLPTVDATQRQSLQNAGYAAVLSMPISEYRLAEAIRQPLNRAQRLYHDQEDSLRAEYTQLLRDLGIPCHLKGFPFLCEALVYLAANPDALYQMTKVLYPHVAQCMDTSAGNVERNMRTALDAMLTHGDPVKIAVHLPSIFSQARAQGGCRCKGRIGTSVLLAALSQSLQLRRNA